MTRSGPDCVVIGAGHNGLVAANLLADRGWNVVVLESTLHAGGAVRSAEVTAPGFTNDLFSSFYPMTATSPVMASLQLERWGLRWTHAPTVLTHLIDNEQGAVLYRDAGRTAAALEETDRGDGAPWLRLSEDWDRYGSEMVRALLSPFPPLRATGRLVMSARSDLWDLVRRSLLPVSRMSEELFSGHRAPLLLAGNALHADVTPESAPSALLGWMLVGLGQTVGFPVPVGGAQRITDALVHRLVAAGGEVRIEEPVERVIVRSGRVVGVRTTHGTEYPTRVVIAACDAQILYGRLVDESDLPPSFLARAARFQRSDGTVKVDYALSGPVPWLDDRAVGAGTVHVADSVDELSMTSVELATGRLPSDPFLLIGQTTTADPTRSPPGTEALWTYTHVPMKVRADGADAIRIDGNGPLAGEALDGFVTRMEDRIERRAPGFRNRIVARHVMGPSEMERLNPSLIGGDISGGTTQLHQQLIFRPVPGLGRAETPIAGLYLGSSSAHPGGSVHGACGANAVAAIVAAGRRRRLGGTTVAATVAASVIAARRINRE